MPAVEQCLICAASLIRQRPGYWYQCSQCGWMMSTLQPGSAEYPSTIDEEQRQLALRELRQANYRCIIERLQQFRPSPASLLDVGCAHGWFLQAASQAGYQAAGIEPDAAMARLAQSSGHEVRIGYFPQELSPESHYDIITFNDVLEHLPDLPRVLDTCRRLLMPDGLLAVTLPNSRGILFRLARLFARVGWYGPLDRMWQRGFPSPHLTYFHPQALAGLMSQYGFEEVDQQVLASVTAGGLWSRLRFDRRSTLMISLFQYAGLRMCMPLMRVLPGDISFQIFRVKRANT